MASIPAINRIYLAAQMRQKSVAVLGASSTSEEVKQFLPWAAALAKEVVARGGNVVTGAGHSGVMGAAFTAAKEAAQAPGAGENLTLIKTPAWGDEDLLGGRAIGRASSEEARLEKFLRVASVVVAFPGGAGTLIELSKLIFDMAYPVPGHPVPDKVVLVGSSTYWQGLRQQLETQAAAGQMSADVLKHFVFVDSKVDLLNATRPAL
jgi:predicted Rossmann-fold nucleotide-binding protein